MTFSQVGGNLGVKNNPSYVQAEALKMLCVNILEPLRDFTGLPIAVHSGYRNPFINERIGGAAASQHCAGQAADITISGMTVSAIITAIRKAKLPFDQLIDEPGWVHVSHCPDRKNRGEVLVARIENGGKVYRALA
jgi:zinc D-Ala-D-Ala carboxypeptidase